MFDILKKINVENILNENKRCFVIEPAVVDHCNLNCAYCDHLTPLADKGFYDVKQFEKDFKILSKVLQSKKVLDKYRIVFQIVGGEPFLHPDLLDFVEIIFNNFDRKNIHNIAIMTNCTMFGQRKDLSYKYRTNIAKYDGLAFIKSHYLPFDAEKIKRDYEEFIGHSVKNPQLEEHLTFDKVNLNFDSTEYPIRCPCDSMYMRDGKLCRCPIIGNAKFLLKRMNLPETLLTDGDYLKIDENLTPEGLIDFHEYLSPFCKYCTPRNYGLNWRHSDFDISEWVDENYINNMRNKN